MSDTPLHVVTSFSQQGYNTYAQLCLKSFLQHWSEEVRLLIYHESQDMDELDWLPEERVTLVNLDKVNYLQYFEFVYRNDKRVRGTVFEDWMYWKANDRRAGYSFRYDAWRFCRKVFAVANAVEKYVNAGKLFWLDADVTTFADVPVSMLHETLPGNVATSYLDRGTYHPDCAYVGYNLDNPQCLPFIKAFAKEYSDFTVFNRKEWHDSYVYNELRKEQGIPSHIIPARSHRSVFENSVLGQYMVHHKGPKKERIAV